MTISTITISGSFSLSSISSKVFFSCQNEFYFNGFTEAILKRRIIISIRKLYQSVSTVLQNLSLQNGPKVTEDFSTFILLMFIFFHSVSFTNKANYRESLFINVYSMRKSIILKENLNVREPLVLVFDHSGFFINFYLKIDSYRNWNKKSLEKQVLEKVEEFVICLQVIDFSLISVYKSFKLKLVRNTNLLVALLVLHLKTPSVTMPNFSNCFEIYRRRWNCRIGDSTLLYFADELQ